MNINIIDTSNKTTTTTQNKTSTTSGNSEDFSKELSNLKKSEETKEETKEEKTKKTDSEEKINNSEKNKENKDNQNNDNTIKDDESLKLDNKNNDKQNLNNAINGLEDVVGALNKLNKTEKQEGEILYNNDLNIGELNTQIMPQMNGGMNFNSDNQQFSDLMQQNQKTKILNNNIKDLAEEENILSTMDENIAMANKNIIDAKVKTVQTNDGIIKVDKEKNITVEIVAKFDDIIMNKADVDFFTQLVNEGTVNLNSFVGDSAKASQVSKTLADMIAKAMKDNQPIRINFDNDISVIIKISRDGKISADFLPSSQIAEAYLKENLPLLKQRFDDNNIDYEELNQRKQQKHEEKDNNRKKGNKDE